MKTATTRLDFRPAILCLVVALSLVAPRARAQLVNDGETNVINGIGINLGVTNLVVGSNGANTMLIFTNGGSATNAIGYIGYTATSTNNSVIVTGTGSPWRSTSDLYVGNSGSFNTLLISNGGSVICRNDYVGNNAGASNNLVVVTGTNSAWNHNADIHVGESGSFNSVLVSNGGTVNGGKTFIGNNSGASNNAVTVTGTNSVWNSSGKLWVGSAGSGNQLSVNGGATVLSANGTIGGTVDSWFNVATVSGAGSLWSNSGFLVVGSNGSFNQLIISNGGTVVSQSGSLGRTNGSGTTPSNNIAIVTGTGSRWDSGSSLVLGRPGYLNNQLLILDGGLVTNIASSVDGLASVVVGGANSRWDNSGDIEMGPNGNCMVLVTNGGALTAASLAIGLANGGQSNTLGIAGSGSLVQVAGMLAVGSNGAFNQVFVSDGAQLRSGAATVGRTLGSVGSNNAVWVSGTGSTWSNAGAMTLGKSGSLISGRNNALIISNGGFVASGSVVVGVGPMSPSASGLNSITVTGSGSLLNAGTNLEIGNSTRSNRMEIRKGAAVTNGDAAIGVVGNYPFSPLSSFNSVLVSDVGSRWDIGGKLAVGKGDTNNSLLITNAGVVSSQSAAVGSYHGPEAWISGGNSVVIGGAGATWTNAGLLLIGGTNTSNGVVLVGGSNVVEILAGGSVVTGSLQLNGGNANVAVGSMLRIKGGGLSVTNANGTGALEVRSRSLVSLDDGTIATDQLFLNYSTSGNFSFNGGTFNVRTASVSNGVAFTVGNETSSATYRMTGAATNGHIFANNLVISSNATLTGNGTIVGSVTNYGTVASGSSPGKINVSGSLYLTNGSLVNFELGGTNAGVDYDQIAVTNFVQFAGSMSLSLLPGYLPNPGDTFTLVSFGVSLGTFNGVFNGFRTSFVTNLLSFQVSYDNNLVLSSVRYADNDGDGQGDLQEYAAGTDPASQASEMRITALARTGGGPVTVTFQSVVGKNYRIEYSTDLITWSVATTAVPANGVGNSTDWIDDGSLTGGLNATTTRRFYRLGLQ